MTDFSNLTMKRGTFDGDEDTFDYDLSAAETPDDGDAYYKIELINATLASVRSENLDQHDSSDPIIREAAILDFALTGDDSF
ncbi:hypothetical protein [Antarctobacter jejuensis]|uniref:hypothetical protein n=1 Tax=Antarctobacter jejuensis TaxID=1439938 RepID=UPI003FD1F4FB